MVFSGNKDENICQRSLVWIFPLQEKRIHHICRNVEYKNGTKQIFVEAKPRTIKKEREIFLDQKG